MGKSEGISSLGIDAATHRQIAIEAASRGVPMKDLIAQAWKVFTKPDGAPVQVEAVGGEDFTPEEQRLIDTCKKQKPLTLATSGAN